jgi:hypothetical protein
MVSPERFLLFCTRHALGWRVRLHEVRLFESLREDSAETQMAATIYYISLPLIYAISLLPFRLLYLLSDFLFTG